MLKPVAKDGAESYTRFYKRTEASKEKSWTRLASRDPEIPRRGKIIGDWKPNQSLPKIHSDAKDNHQAQTPVCVEGDKTFKSQ